MKNWKCIIFLIAYGEMHDLLAWKRLVYLIKFLRIDFMDLLYYLKDLKMLYLDLWYLGKLIQNILDNKWVWRLWEPCEYIGYFKGFCETTWNWAVFWFHVNCELFMFYLWPVTCDYPTKYYSLCDISILAPIFVMVMNSRFVSANEFRLFVGNEFRLYVDNCPVALGWNFGFGIVLLLLTIYKCSIMLAYFEEYILM